MNLPQKKQLKLRPPIALAENKTAAASQRRVDKLAQKYLDDFELTFPDLDDVLMEQHLHDLVRSPQRVYDSILPFMLLSIACDFKGSPKGSDICEQATSMYARLLACAKIAIVDCGPKKKKKKP